MVETGKVIKLKGDRAVIRVDRKSACDNCRMCAIKPKSPHIDIILKNEVNAKIEDWVEIEIDDHVVVKSSLVVYTIPLITAFFGLLIGFLAFKEAAYQLIMFTGFLLVGFVVVFFIDKLIKNNKKYKQRITRIVTKEVQND